MRQRAELGNNCYQVLCVIWEKFSPLLSIVQGSSTCSHLLPKCYSSPTHPVSNLKRVKPPPSAPRWDSQSNDKVIEEVCPTTVQTLFVSTDKHHSTWPPKMDWSHLYGYSTPDKPFYDSWACSRTLHIHAQKHTTESFCFDGFTLFTPHSFSYTHCIGQNAIETTAATTVSVHSNKRRPALQRSSGFTPMHAIGTHHGPAQSFMS